MSARLRIARWLLRVPKGEILTRLPRTTGVYVVTVSAEGQSVATVTIAASSFEMELGPEGPLVLTNDVDLGAIVRHYYPVRRKGTFSGTFG